LAVAIAAFVVQGLARNSAIEWTEVGHYLFSSQIMSGVRLTIVLTALSMAIALLIGVVIALMRLHRNALLRRIAHTWILFFRGLPILVLLTITFNFGLLYSHVGFGVPFGPTFASVDTRTLVTPFVAALAAFALNESAFSAEIFRAGILAVPQGQREAGKALGMPPAMIFFKVVAPQAVRFAIPPLTNNLINLLKGTALVSIVGVFDLMYSAQAIYQSNYKVMPLLTVAAIWYIVIVSVLSGFQYWLERWLSGKVHSRNARSAIWRRVKSRGAEVVR